MVKLNVEQLDIGGDKFDCYRQQDKCNLPPKDSEPNVSESHVRANIYCFQQFRILVYIFLCNLIHTCLLLLNSILGQVDQNIPPN